MELRDAWPGRVTATEEHPLNFQLTTDRLSPLGVRVASVRLTEIDPLPFDDADRQASAKVGGSSGVFLLGRRSTDSHDRSGEP